MSIFDRMGMSPYLSLDNKKGVDIILHRDDDKVQVIEVKGVAGKMDRMTGNSGEFRQAPGLFYALVSFNGRIADLSAQPDFWLIPSSELAKVGEHAIAGDQKTVFLRNSHIRKTYQPYMNTLTSLG